VSIHACSAAVQSGTSALIFLPLALILGGRFELGSKLIASTLWLGIGMSMGALIVFVTLVRRIDASRVGALLLLVPAVTAIASWPALGEPLHPLTLVGMVIAAAGAGTVLRRRSATAPAAAAEHSRAAGAEQPAGAVGAGQPAGAGRRASAEQPAGAGRRASAEQPARPGAAARRQPAATRDRKRAASGAANGNAKICPGHPSTLNVTVGAKP
jgi:multidrug transporter EmrE-like cation transporter